MPIVKTFKEPVVEPPLKKISVPGINSATGEESERTFSVEDASDRAYRRFGICALLCAQNPGGSGVSSFVTVEQARAIAGALNEFADRAEGVI